MHVKNFMRQALLLGGALTLAGCVTRAPQPAPPAPAASPMPAEPAASSPRVILVPAAPSAPEPGDLAARRLLGFHEQVRQLAPAELAGEVNRLSAVVSATASAAPADAVLELALALMQQRNPGDLSRAVALLEPVARSSAPELAPWQPMARLLLARALEQRRLEEQLAREISQRRDQQRTLQQLNEKLEALKAIERSMTARPPAAAAPVPAAPPAAPKTP